MKGTTIFSDYLQLLGVPFTGGYSDSQFTKMPFKSLFGFSRLLNSYGVETESDLLSDKSQISIIPTPFVAKKKDKFVIVTDISDNGSDGKVVRYLYYGKPSSEPIDKFIDVFTGVVLRAFPNEKSAEPSYGKHHFFEIAAVAKNLLFFAALIFLFIYGFIKAGLYENVSTILLTIVDLAGLYVTWLLILKSLKVKSQAADKVCGVLQKHGCDTVLEQKASKFFGLFGWSEVGICYFAITLLIMLIFPGELHYLALINGCCLPFTVWSITYQKFVIKTWCTLCVTTQALLWLQFFCYFFGGWWRDIFPLRIDLFLMGAAYLAALLGVNKVMEFIEKSKK